ncbi:MAG: hypothetical protein ACLRQF_02225 [Thomasclavelia ramosa]
MSLEIIQTLNPEYTIKSITDEALELMVRLLIIILMKQLNFV